MSVRRGCWNQELARHPRGGPWTADAASALVPPNLRSLASHFSRGCLAEPLTHGGDFISGSQTTPFPLK